MAPLTIVFTLKKINLQPKYLFNSKKGALSPIIIVIKVNNAKS